MEITVWVLTILPAITRGDINMHCVMRRQGDGALLPILVWECCVSCVFLFVSLFRPFTSHSHQSIFRLSQHSWLRLVPLYFCSEIFGSWWIVHLVNKRMQRARCWINEPFKPNWIALHINAIYAVSTVKYLIVSRNYEYEFRIYFYDVDVMHASWTILNQWMF